MRKMEDKHYYTNLKLEIVKRTKLESVAIFGVRQDIPELIALKKQGRLEVFNSKKRRKGKGGNDANKTLHALSDISRYGADVCFLDHEAIKVLIAKYPNSSQYVLVRLQFSFTFLVGLAGLFRRVKKKMVRVRGVISLKNSGRGSSRWMVLENSTTQVQNPIYLSLSEDVGIDGLITFLNEQKTRYVVPRFFESFPNLHRPEGGDVDLLVDDEDAPVVRKFLKENSGRIPVDLHTVYGPAPGSGNMPYFLPKLANAMLDGHTIGPIGTKIPNDKDYYFSFLYHILYHKGFFSGVVSRDFPDVEKHTPENNYGQFAVGLAKVLGYDLLVSLESFEKVLEKEGYIPKLDTLSAIARLNKWVRWHYFGSKKIQEIGLSVLLLKKIAHKRNWIPQIEQDIRDEGFTVIKHEVFNEKQVKELSGILRGGNWHVSSENKNDYLPNSVYVLMDNMHTGSVKATSGTKESRIRLLKTKLRKKYNQSLDSFVHTTDDTEQSWEYIKDIWPEKILELKEIVNTRMEDTSIRKNSLGMIVKTRAHIIKERIKEWILLSYE